MKIRLWNSEWNNCGAELMTMKIKGDRKTLGWLDWKKERKLEEQSISCWYIALVTGWWTGATGGQVWYWDEPLRWRAIAWWQPTDTDDTGEVPTLNSSAESSGSCKEKERNNLGGLRSSHLWGYDQRTFWPGEAVLPNNENSMGALDETHANTPG